MVYPNAMIRRNLAKPKRRPLSSPPSIQRMPYQAIRMAAKERKRREPISMKAGSFAVNRLTMYWTVPLGS